MKRLLIIIIGLSLLAGACTPTSLIYKGSSTSYVNANTKKFQQQKKARWKYKAKKQKIYARHHH